MATPQAVVLTVWSWDSSINISRELARNAHSQALPQTYWTRNSRSHSQNHVSNNPSGWFWCIVEVENHYSKVNWLSPFLVSWKNFIIQPELDAWSSYLTLPEFLVPGCGLLECSTHEFPWIFSWGFPPTSLTSFFSFLWGLLFTTHFLGCFQWAIWHPPKAISSTHPVLTATSICCWLSNLYLHSSPSPELKLLQTSACCKYLHLGVPLSLQIQLFQNWVPHLLLKVRSSFRVAVSG